AHLLDHAVVYAGLRPVLDTLATEGAVFSVLTNKPEDMSASILRGLGLETLCPRLVGGDTLPVRKPDPTGFRRLIAAADGAPGATAGVATCAVFWGFNGQAVRGAGADVEIAAPAELLPICRHGITAV